MPSSEAVEKEIRLLHGSRAADALFRYLRDNMPAWTYDEIRAALRIDHRQAKDTAYH